MARVGTLVMCLHDAADVLIEVRLCETEWAYIIKSILMWQYLILTLQIGKITRICMCKCTAESVCFNTTVKRAARSVSMPPPPQLPTTAAAKYLTFYLIDLQTAFDLFIYLFFDYYIRFVRVFFRYPPSSSEMLDPHLKCNDHVTLVRLPPASCKKCFPDTIMIKKKKKCAIRVRLLFLANQDGALRPPWFSIWSRCADASRFKTPRKIHHSRCFIYIFFRLQNAASSWACRCRHITCCCLHDGTD